MAVHQASTLKDNDSIRVDEVRFHHNNNGLRQLVRQ